MDADTLTARKLLEAWDGLRWGHLTEDQERFRRKVVNADVVEFKASPYAPGDGIYAMDVPDFFAFRPRAVLVVCHPDHENEARTMLAAFGVRYADLRAPTQEDKERKDGTM